MKVAISGASGFVGSRLRELFSDHVVLGRNDSTQELLEKLKGVDVVINLAGANILQRWTPSYKQTLRTSRIDLTKKLVSAINQSDVGHFISTSAVGIYPDGKAYNESSSEVSDDFLGALARDWEAQANSCEKPTAILRFGVVLGDGGALSKMLPPFRLGLGGIIGNGEMMMSWIDIEDLLNMYSFIIDKKLSGVFNAVAPNPVSNYAFTKALGAVLRRPTIFPLPIFVLKVIFGDASIVLSGSKEIYPKALSEAGFVFKYATISSSLEHILKQTNK